MNKSAIFGLFLMTSLLAGTAVNMNMLSPAMAAMGQGMGQYYNNNNYQSEGNITTTITINQNMKNNLMEVTAMRQVTLMIRVMTI